MEIIDVYNANLKLIGTEERKEAHKKGLWHITFHCWLVSDYKGGSILVQMRSRDNNTYPGSLDISAAGHLMTGETVKDGIREVSEELGIDINEDNLYNLGYRVEVADSPNKMNREYQAVHMLKCEGSLCIFSPQQKEVAGLYWIPIKEGMQLFTGNIESVESDGIEINNEEKYIQTKRDIKAEDFIPRLQKYYLTMCIMAERLLEGKDVFAIS